MSTVSSTKNRGVVDSIVSPNATKPPAAGFSSSVTTLTSFVPFGNSITTPMVPSSTAAGGGSIQGNGPLAEGNASITHHHHQHPPLLPGMRREWHFSLYFLHASARVQLFCPPHWEPTFIEPERMKALHTLDRDVKHCPMTPALRFLDYSVPPLVGPPLGGGGGGGPTPTTGGGAGGGSSSLNEHGIGRSSMGGGELGEEFGGGRSGAYMDIQRDLSMQNAKVVELLYSHIPHTMSLSAYCCRSVQHILKDPHITAIDGEKRLRRLRIGKKLSSCPYRLGGQRSFHFYYYIQQKTELITHDVGYCVGTIVGQRGYLLTVRGSDQESLDAYVLHLLMPYMSNPVNLKLNVTVEYNDHSHADGGGVGLPAVPPCAAAAAAAAAGTATTTSFGSGYPGVRGGYLERGYPASSATAFPSPYSCSSSFSPYLGQGMYGGGGSPRGMVGGALLSSPFSSPTGTAAVGAAATSARSGGANTYIPDHRPHEDYGEIRYEDHDAAVAFSLALRPLRFRPDFSPTKTVGVGSIACMTLELNVYEKLIDDESMAEIAGMPKYKINQVLLCLEVEDVARMNYPGVMTTAEYAELKNHRLLEGLADARVVGTGTSLLIGQRIGCSQVITFQYEPFNGVAKGMYVSTLVGNFGVTAYYLTKLGGGYFETHLYIFKELLRRLEYQPQHRDNMMFSRFDVVNVRLLETELYRCYSTAPANQKEAFQLHLQALSESNDGQADGAVVVAVPEEDGGYVEVGAGGGDGGLWIAGRSTTGGVGKGLAGTSGGGGDLSFSVEGKERATSSVSLVPGETPTRRGECAGDEKEARRESSGRRKTAGEHEEKEGEEKEGEEEGEEGHGYAQSETRAGSRRKDDGEGEIGHRISDGAAEVVGGKRGKRPVSSISQEKEEGREGYAVAAGEEEGNLHVDDVEELSSHSLSVITVSSLLHLQVLLTDDDEEEEIRGGRDVDVEEEAEDGGDAPSDMAKMFKGAARHSGILTSTTSPAPGGGGWKRSSTVGEAESGKWTAMNDKEEGGGDGEERGRSVSVVSYHSTDSADEIMEAEEGEKKRKASEVEEEEEEGGGGVKKSPPLPSQEEKEEGTAAERERKEERKTVGKGFPTEKATEEQRRGIMKSASSARHDGQDGDSDAAPEEELPLKEISAVALNRMGEKKMKGNPGYPDDHEEEEQEQEGRHFFSEATDSPKAKHGKDDDEDNKPRKRSTFTEASSSSSPAGGSSSNKSRENRNNGKKPRQRHLDQEEAPPESSRLSFSFPPHEVDGSERGRASGSGGEEEEGRHPHHHGGGAVVSPPPPPRSPVDDGGSKSNGGSASRSGSTAGNMIISNTSGGEGGRSPAGKEEQGGRQERFTEGPGVSSSSPSPPPAGVEGGGGVPTSGVPIGWKAPTPAMLSNSSSHKYTSTTGGAQSEKEGPVPVSFTSGGGVVGGGGAAAERTKQLLTGPAVRLVMSTIAAAKPSFPPPPTGNHASPSILHSAPSSHVPTVRDIYLYCCVECQCKPNSHLLDRLPLTDGRTGVQMIEELDLSGNYVGHSGFTAVLRFLEHLPLVSEVYFNNMELDNLDVENLCGVLASHPTIKGVHLRNNPSITLVATKHLYTLLRMNPNIHILSLQGTRVGDAVIGKLESKAAENKQKKST